MKNTQAAGGVRVSQTAAGEDSLAEDHVHSMKLLSKIGTYFLASCNNSVVSETYWSSSEEEKKRERIVSVLRWKYDACIHGSPIFPLHSHSYERTCSVCKIVSWVDNPLHCDIICTHFLDLSLVLVCISCRGCNTKASPLFGGGSSCSSWDS